MTFPILLKQIFASILNSTGYIAKRLKEARREGVLILMYHRILPEEEARRVTQAGMYVDPSTFQDHISFLNDHFTVIPLESVKDIRRESLGRVEKPFCAITFDDGWFDFYQHAFPILLESKTPSTVFLPTDLIGTDVTFWSEQVVRLFRKAKVDHLQPDKPVHPEVEAIERLQGTQEDRIERSIELLKEIKGQKATEIVEELSERWNVDVENKERDFLTWEEVRELHRSGLVSFGSHTAGHKILTTLTMDEVVWELENSKKRMISEGVADPDFFPFCYPNGDYTEEIAEAVEKAGYSLAVTTKDGWNRPEDGVFTLSRIGIHQDMANTPAMFGCRLSGIF